MWLLGSLCDARETSLWLLEAVSREVMLFMLAGEL